MCEELSGGGPLWVLAYETIIQNELYEFFTTTEKTLNNIDVLNILKKAYSNNLDCVQKAANSKKPTSNELMEFLSPTIEAIKEMDEIRHKSNYYQSIYETLLIISWITIESPMNYIIVQSQSTNFYLNKISKTIKTESIESKWIKSVKKLNKAIEIYVTKYHLLGLKWNINKNGCSISEAKSNNARCLTSLFQLNQKEIELKKKEDKLEKYRKREIQSNKLKLLIAGYLRFISMDTHKSLFAIDIINNYSKKLNAKYIDILIDKQQHKHLGTESNNDNFNEFDVNSDWYFDSNICPNCCNRDCLKFMVKYKNKPKDENKIEANIWYNDCDEYQCNVCKYFIGVNIKEKYMSYHYLEDKESTNISWILWKPAQRKDLKIIKKNNIESQKCIECKDEMEIIQRREENYAYQGYEWHDIDYCKKCQIIRYKLKNNWSLYD